MIEKKRIEIFPKHMGFFPYMWLVYLLFPIYNLTQVSGWKLVIGKRYVDSFHDRIPSTFILSRRRLFCGLVFK
ncbi:hypothetical protein ACT7DO_17185 [Bacillus pacificus]